MEAKFFIDSLGLEAFRLINIDNLPFLVSSVVSLVCNNWLSFNIFVTFNIKTLFVLDVNKLVASVLEDLPPI
jgi:hypothetical protein